MSEWITYDQYRKDNPIDPKIRLRGLTKILDVVGGVRLAELRKAKKLTQVQVAKKLKIDQSNVSRIERGSFSKIELQTLRRYVEAMGGELEIRIRIDHASHQLIDSEYEKSWARKLARESRSSRAEKPLVNRGKKRSAHRASVAKPRKKATITSRKAKTLRTARAKRSVRTSRPS